MKNILLIVCLILSICSNVWSQQLSPIMFSGSVDENAFLLSDDDGSVLIDALRSSADAEKIVSHLKVNEEVLKTIFITHGHPDHFLGLAYILSSFPDAEVFVSNQHIKQDIINYANYATKMGLMDSEAKMKPMQVESLAGFDYQKIIQVLEDDKLLINKSTYLTISNLNDPSESAHAAILFNEAEQIIFSGDIVVNGVFPWLGTGVEEVNLENWISQLNNIKIQFGIGDWLIYPGHGAVDGIHIVDDNIDYLATFEQLMQRTTSRADAFDLFKSLYPDHRGDFLLRRSIDNWYHRTRGKRLISIKNIVDLTHTLSEDFPYIPVPGITFPFSSEPIAKIDEIGVGANKWHIHEHIGTQIDAPNHFIPDGMALEELNVTDLIVPVIVIDISERALNNPDTELTLQDIKSWEETHGKIPNNACVMMNSGWEKYLYEDKYLGIDENHTKHFPGISTEAAIFLIEQRTISGVGVDVISFDPGYDNEYKTHKIILGAGKWALEAVANLDEIPPVGANLFVGSPKIKGATGGISRIIAVW